jgi:hypothetical protein
MNRIRRIPDENIIIVTNNLEITAELVDENRAMCRQLMAQMDGPVVLIIDYREAKTNFAEIINIIKGNQAGKRADLNERTFTIMVGTDQLINMYRDSMRMGHSGGVSVPYFADLDSALVAARNYLEERAADHSA